MLSIISAYIINILVARCALKMCEMVTLSKQELLKLIDIWQMTEYSQNWKYAIGTRKFIAVCRENYMKLGMIENLNNAVRKLKS